MIALAIARTGSRSAQPVWLAAFAGLLLLASARQCLAWPEYPQVVSDSLHLPPPPPDCTLCHTTNQGGPGTATKPFARTVQQFGVGAAQDPSLLESALEQVKACKTDSDGDGVSDVDEITSNGDPNDGHGTPTSQCGDIYTGPLAQTGCFVRGGASAASWPWLATFVAACIALGAAARRRARGSASLR